MERRINIIKLYDDYGDCYTFTLDGLILFRFATPSNICQYTLSEAKKIAKKQMRKRFVDYEIVDLEETGY
jgi:hypothetical protein